MTGTYVYQAAHGIGRPGELKRAHNYKYKGTLKGFLAAMRDNANRRGTR